MLLGINNYGTIVCVLEDKHSDPKTAKDKQLMCRTVLKLLLDEQFIVSALILAYTL